MGFGRDEEAGRTPVVLVKMATGQHIPLEVSMDCIDELLKSFCWGRALAKKDVFDGFLVPRFREIFNADPEIAALMRGCAESCMVTLAGQFDAEKSAVAASAAIDSILNLRG